MLADAKLPGFAPHVQTQTDPNPTSGFTDRLPSSIFANVKMLPAATATVPCLVPQIFDLVSSQPASVGGPSLFVTSNQCASCHDATDNAPMPTHMLYTPPGASAAVNVSSAGEWQYSMTALAARDPIFLAQVDTESTVHGNIQGIPNPPGFVQDTCLSCHGVMGQRQFHIDKGNAPGTLFHPRPYCKIPPRRTERWRVTGSRARFAITWPTITWSIPRLIRGSLSPALPTQSMVLIPPALAT